MPAPAAQPAVDCIDENVVVALCAGRLPPEELLGIEAHLAHCASCRRVVAFAGSLLRSAPAGRLESAATSMAPLFGFADAQSVLDSLRMVEDADYLVQRQIAQGGMGRILLAVDRHGRRVAIKVLLESDESSKLRFIREMQITATLQHPSIVTLYEAGRWRSGDPFFAMKLVEGRSLAEELASGLTLGDRLALVPRLLSVTEALAYAHDRGVIHRDLKPSNVLVGSFGETVVIDWGLAKRQGASEPALLGADANASDARLSGLTAVGAALGTPAYMAPEQAQGVEMDERTDVYGLGALLYHVLCGEPPYTGGSARDVLAQVLRGPPAPLELRVAQVPQDLAAVVRKAMMPNPADRYPSAKQMAEDLRRFSAGQLVSVYSYSSAALIRRWIRKHRAAVLVAAVLLVIGSAAGVASVTRIIRERNRAEGLQRAATEQRGAAEELVDYLIVEFRRRVEATDRLDLLLGLGENVAAYYRRSDPGVVADADALGRRSSALQALGLVEQDKHNADKALSLYHDAVDLRRRASTLRPASAADLVTESVLWHNIGVIEVGQGRFEQGMTSLRQALAAGEQAIAKDPSHLSGYLRAARAEERMAGALQLHTQDSAGALRYALAARDRLAPLLATYPARADLLARLGSMEGQVGLLQLELAQLGHAFDSTRASLGHYARATDLEPQDGVWARGHAVAFLRVSRLELARRRLPEAEAALRSHLQRYEVIARAEAENAATQLDLAWSYVHACDLERSAGRLERSEQACQQAHVVIQRLLEQADQDINSRKAALGQQIESARLDQLRGRAPAAAAALSRALERARGLAAQEPENRHSQWCVASVLQYLVPLEVEGSLDSAAEHIREGIEIVERLVASTPTIAQFSEARLALRSALAQLQLRQGQPEAAAALYTELANDAEQGIARWPEWLALRVRQAEVLLGLAAATEASSDGAAARKSALAQRSRALQQLDELRKKAQLLAEEEPLRARALRDLRGK